MLEISQFPNPNFPPPTRNYTIIRAMNKRTRGNRPIDTYHFAQRDTSSLAPRVIKPIEDNIERSHEYNVFMKSLEDFHKSHG